MRLKQGCSFNAEIIEAVCESLKFYQWDNIVVDPVMIAKGGASLLQLGGYFCDEAVPAANF